MDNSIEYEEKSVKTVYQVQAIAEEYLRELAAQPTDRYADAEIRRLIIDFCEQEKVYGSEKEFHNLAVDLAKSNLEDLACVILERGIKMHKNVDLLAGYLKYGLSCGHNDKCQDYYNILNKISKRIWTWRGFSFSIDYLQYKLDNEVTTDREIDEIIREIELIANEYMTRIPCNEDSYIVRARVYKTVNDNPEKELEILKECMSKIKVCSRAALRCADIYFEQGEYSDALECVQRALNDANRTQGSINEGYGYYLSGLCKLAELPRDREKVDKADIEEIYADFNSAMIDFGWGIERTYRDIIVKKTKNIKIRYDVEIPYRFGKLIEYIEE